MTLEQLCRAVDQAASGGGTLDQILERVNHAIAQCQSRG